MKKPPSVEEAQDYKEYNEFAVEMMKKESLEPIMMESNEMPFEEWNLIRSSKFNITDSSYSSQECLSHDNDGIYSFLVKCSSGRVLMSVYKKIS